MQTKAKVGQSLRYWSVSSLLATLVLALLFLAGCATPKPIPGAKKDLLEFLRPGYTTREEVLSTLGGYPWVVRVFEQDKILTYRLGHDEKQGYYISEFPRGWYLIRYSLVLVFDSDGVLNKYSLVDVK